MSSDEYMELETINCIQSCLSFFTTYNCISNITNYKQQQILHDSINNNVNDEF